MRDRSISGCGPERRRATCNWCSVQSSHHADSTTTALVARAITSPNHLKSSNVSPAMNRCRPTVSAQLRRQHAPFPLDWNKDVRYLTFTQHFGAIGVFATARPRPRLW